MTPESDRPRTLKKLQQRTGCFSNQYERALGKSRTPGTRLLVPTCSIATLIRNTGVPPVLAIRPDQKPP